MMTAPVKPWDERPIYPSEPDYQPRLHPGAPGTMRAMIPLVLVRTTPRAYLVRDPAGREHWMPRSIVGVSRNDEFRPDGQGEVVDVHLPVWLVRKCWTTRK